VTIQFSVETPGLARLASAIEDESQRRTVIGNLLDRVAREVHARAVRLIHKRTAHTAGTVIVQVNRTALSAWVGPTSLVGAILELGSAPHEILPKAASALMVPVHPNAGASGSPTFGGSIGPRGTMRLTGGFKFGQQFQFFRSVHHPGTNPYPYLRPAAESAMPFIDESVAMAGRQIIDKMMGSVGA